LCKLLNSFSLTPFDWAKMGSFRIFALQAQRLKLPECLIGASVHAMEAESTGEGADSYARLLEVMASRNSMVVGSDSE
jgi:hypothetical protein